MTAQALEAPTTGHTCPNCKSPTGLRAIVEGKVTTIPGECCSTNKVCAVFGCNRHGTQKATMPDESQVSVCGACALDIDRDMSLRMQGLPTKVLLRPTPEQEAILRTFSADTKKCVEESMLHNREKIDLVPAWETNHSRSTLASIHNGNRTWEEISAINAQRAKQPSHPFGEIKFR
jgi:hypothetical protein